MSIINTEDIVGIYTEDYQFKCCECMTKEDWDSLTQENVIPRKTVEEDDDKVFFCDICGQRL
ncbi:hypothetical protein KKI24_18345 [bacterium]|nr:hypothetical protein [bacterium]